MTMFDESDLCCSVITVAEIHAGMRDHERARTEQLLDSLTQVDVSREIAETAGAFRKNVRSHTLEFDDCLIAATAFVKRAALATCNAKHYPMKEIEKIVVKV